jgi:exopolysaccharide biosynthesis polyprenyl glycosylphosphotransferase
VDPEVRLESHVDDVLVDITDGGSPIIDLRGADAALEIVRPAGLLAAPAWQLTAKRAIDILGALVAAVLTLPLLLVVAIAIKATSRGPVLYAQERVGRNGETFRMYKLRSMCVDAHERKHEHGGRNMHGGPIFKIRDDPRVTRVGRVLRRLSIDELPQLWNVLRGEMSLVGPRPPLPEEYEQYGPRERRRLLVKPGITCIWQVRGRSDLDFETWVRMDLEYIETWSLALDAKLLTLTLPAVLSGRGAY